MANKENIEYQLTEKGKEIAEKTAENNIKKDEIQASISEQIVKPTAERESARLLRELKELDAKIAEAKKLEKEKKKQTKRVQKETKKVENEKLVQEHIEEVLEDDEAGAVRHGMGYKRAKDIRSKSFGSLLAEQEGGLGESLRKTISLKTKAKMTGFKESFDPLNIAKKLTFGSNWAPAMLGKLTGRSREDTGYFANAKMRASSTGGNVNTASKVGSLNYDNDLTSPLMEILTLMQKTNEEDTKRKEQENQYKEILDAKKQKRHEELIAALTGKKGKTTTATKVKDAPTDSSPGGILSNILDTLGGFKSAMSLFGVLGTIFVGGSIASWFAASVAADPNFQKAFSRENDPNGLLGAMSGDSAFAAGILGANGDLTPEQVRAKQEEKKKALSDEGMLTRVYGVGETEALKKKGYTQEQIDELRGNTAEKKRVADEKQQAKLIESFDKKGGDLTKATMEELEAKKQQQVEYGYAKGDLVKAINTEIQKRKNSTATSVPKTNTTSESTKGKSESTPTTSSGSATQTAAGTAASVPTTDNAGAKLNAVTTQNLDAKISSSSSTIPTSTVTTNNMNSSKISPTAKMALPAVRNQEDTFQRMILNSTRIV